MDNAKGRPSGKRCEWGIDKILPAQNPMSSERTTAIIQRLGSASVRTRNFPLKSRPRFLKHDVSADKWNLTAQYSRGGNARALREQSPARPSRLHSDIEQKRRAGHPDRCQISGSVLGGGMRSNLMLSQRGFGHVNRGCNQHRGYGEKHRKSHTDSERPRHNSGES